MWGPDRAGATSGCATQQGRMAPCTLTPSASDKLPPIPAGGAEQAVCRQAALLPAAGLEC